MHTQSNNECISVSGKYEDVKIEVVPTYPPLSDEEKSSTSANYPTELASFHIYLDGQIVTELIPPAYVMFLLDHLLNAVANFPLGKASTAEWFSDPWQFDLTPFPEENLVSITLHVPGKWVALKGAKVPLRQFSTEVIRVATQWKKYIQLHYSDEVANTDTEKQFKQFSEYLDKARSTVG